MSKALVAIETAMEHVEAAEGVPAKEALLRVLSKAAMLERRVILGRDSSKSDGHMVAYAAALTEELQ